MVGYRAATVEGAQAMSGWATDVSSQLLGRGEKRQIFRPQGTQERGMPVESRAEGGNFRRTKGWQGRGYLEELKPTGED